MVGAEKLKVGHVGPPCSFETLALFLTPEFETLAYLFSGEASRPKRGTRPRPQIYWIAEVRFELGGVPAEKTWHTQMEAIQGAVPLFKKGQVQIEPLKKREPQTNINEAIAISRSRGPRGGKWKDRRVQTRCFERRNSDLQARGTGNLVGREEGNEHHGSFFSFPLIYSQRAPLWPHLNRGPWVFLL